VYDGILLACLSEDVDGVRYVIDRLERRARLPRVLEERLDRVDAPADAPDRAWLRLPAKNSMQQPVVLSCRLIEHSEQSTRGIISANFSVPPAEDIGSCSDISAMQRLLGDTPNAMVVLPIKYIEKAFLVNSAPEWLKICGRGLKGMAQEDGKVFACLLNDDFSGPILGFKTPAVVMGVKVKDGNVAMAIIPALLDVINAKYNSGLIPIRDNIGNAEVVTLGGAMRGLYSSVKPEDRLAFFVRDGWFVIVSNVDTAKRLLAVNGGNDARWNRTMTGHKGFAFGWADLEAANQAIRNISALYSLAMMAQNRGGDDALRCKLDSMRSWTESLKMLGMCQFWLSSDRHGAVLDFQFGHGRPETAAHGN
jgi:hypothetical protein